VIALDVDFARSQFPALTQHWPDWALFDNAGGSVAPRQVSARVADYMSRYMVQLGADYALSQTATSIVQDAHAFAGQLLGARAGEIAIASSTTMCARLLASALRPLWRAGDKVIITQADHEANIGPWTRLAETGIEVLTWRLRPETASLELDDLTPLLDERVKLVCMTHCANVVGKIHDVRAVAAAVHQVGAQLVVDGVAYAPHRLVDVAALDVDYYLLSLYKVYGPHLAVLWGRSELLAAAFSQNHDFLDGAMPYKLEPGSASHELCAGVPGIGEYLLAIDEHHGAAAPGKTDDIRAAFARVFELFTAHEQQLAERLLVFLRAHPKVRIIGPETSNADVRVPTIAFTVAGRKASEIPALLATRKLAIRSGHFYAVRAIEALGLERGDGVVRVSMVHYNTLAEVDRLVQVLDEVL
jgi:cysteine desulfurase family protein (TIGR01976 family)